MKPAIAPRTPRSRSLLLGAVIGGMWLAIAGTGAAQSMPDSENGRYALAPMPDGLIRLDTRTGGMSSCTNTGTGWACHAIPDERDALDAEIGRLQAENEKLKAQLAARDGSVTGKSEEAMPKSDSLKKAEPKPDEDKRLQIPLPSDKELDRVMSFLERAWRRLIDIANRVQKDVAGKI